MHTRSCNKINKNYKLALIWCVTSLWARLSQFPLWTGSYNYVLLSGHLFEYLQTKAIHPTVLHINLDRGTWPKFQKVIVILTSASVRRGSIKTWPGAEIKSVQSPDWSRILVGYIYIYIFTNVSYLENKSS